MSASRRILLGAGFNAHKQLGSPTGDAEDVRSFSEIPIPVSDTDVQFVYSCWSSTVFRHGCDLIGLGSGAWVVTMPYGTTVHDLHDAFGDHDGMVGCLDTAGRLHLLRDAQPTVKYIWRENDDTPVDDRTTLERLPLSTEGHPAPNLQCQGDDRPLLSHIAVAGNGKVAITFKQAPNDRLCHVLTFDTVSHFKDWFHDLSGGHYDVEKQHFMMQGRPKQLVANTATFLLLMEEGEVYSWGDPRYHSLGRSIADVPAEKPAVLDALGGLKIAKVACGGWIGAAVSEDGACYIWGAGNPGKAQVIRCLKENGAGAISLVHLPAGLTSEPLDIIDVGVGDNHLAVLGKDGRLFVVGDNKHGQLGLGLELGFVEDWNEVSSVSKLSSVHCGPQTTFVSMFLILRILNSSLVRNRKSSSPGNH